MFKKIRHYSKMDIKKIWSNFWIFHTAYKTTLSNDKWLLDASGNANLAVLSLMFLILNMLKWKMTLQPKTLKPSWMKKTTMQYNQTQRAMRPPLWYASPQTGTSPKMSHGQTKAKVVEVMRAIDVQITKIMCGFLWKKNWWAVLAENKERISETATFKNMTQVMWP